MLEVQPHVVTILSDTALRESDLDENAAMEAKQRAEEALKDQSSEMDFAKAEASLAEAIVQLKMIERSRQKKNRH